MKRKIYPFWEGVCPEPPADDLNMCRFMITIQSYIKKHIRRRITENGYPKTQESVLEYIKTASAYAMAEMIMIGYIR